MTLSIEIVSDFVCPYCWLGKKRLDAALAKRPDLETEILWRPFELDHEVPADGLPYRDYMIAKFGGGEAAAARIDAAWAQMTEAGKAVGAGYRFEDIKLRRNTLDAHRLMRWAQADGKGDAAAEALFTASFAEPRDIGDIGVLAAIAGEIGMDEEAVRARLATDEDAAAVREEEAVYQRMGVRGVPTFILNRRLAMSGAQEPDHLLMAFDRAMAA